MQLITILGAALLLVSISLTVSAFVQACKGQTPDGFLAVILVQLFSSSTIMISLGIIGYYLGKIHEASKDRPRYIIAGTCGESHDEETVLHSV